MIEKCEYCGEVYDRGITNMGECPNCKYWISFINIIDDDDNIIIADGHVYVINPNEDAPSSFKGFGG